MSFSTIKENQFSEKITLIRIEPARFVNDDLVLNLGLYEINFPFPISKIKVNDTLLTRVNSSPAVDEYTWNEFTKDIKINLSTPPSSTVSVIIYYYVFLTNDKFRTIGENPNSPNINKREWQPIIKKSPSVSQSIENSINGKLSISSSSIQLINDNFEKYLTVNDSFYKKEVIYWSCLDSIENIEKIFVGRITELKLDREYVNLRVDDNLGVLDEIALMGDSPDEAYYNKSFYPNLDPNKNGYPRRFIFGSSSRYKTINETGWPIPQGQQLDPFGQSMEEAICISFSTTVSSTTNRTFGICRVPSDGFLDFGFTPSSVDNTTYATVTAFYGTNAEVSKFTIGDTFEVKQGMTTAYVRAIYIDKVSNILYTDKAIGITTGAIIYGNDCPSIMIYESNLNASNFIHYGRDYTTSVTTTSSGNKLLNITFNDNFEPFINSGAGMPTLDPSRMKVQYKVRPNISNMEHGSVLEMLLNKSGISTNSSSFNQANLDLVTNANFSIPYFDEPDYGNYYKYIEDLLESILGFIYLDNNLDMNYKLFSTPNTYNPANDTITYNEILEDTFETEIKYNDIVNQIISYNPHHENIENISSSSTSQFSNKSKYLHNVNRITRLRHLLEDMTQRIQDHVNLRSERLVNFQFSTKTKNLDSLIGADLLLKNKNIIGNESQKGVKILQLSKSNETVDLIASDLYNL